MPDLHIEKLTMSLDPETIIEALADHMESLNIGDIASEVVDNIVSEIDMDSKAEYAIANALDDIDIEELVKDEARDRIRDLDIFEVFGEVMPEHFGPELEEIQGHLADRAASPNTRDDEVDTRLHQQARHIEELRDRLEALHSESVWSFLRRKIFGGRAW